MCAIVPQAEKVLFIIPHTTITPHSTNSLHHTIPSAQSSLMFKYIYLRAYQLDGMLKAQNTKLDHCLEFQIPDGLLVRRITGRLVHPASGRSYHREFYPPKKSMTVCTFPPSSSLLFSSPPSLQSPLTSPSGRHHRRAPCVKERRHP